MMSNKKFMAVLLLVAAAVSSAYAQFSGPAPLAWRWQQSATDAPTGSPVVSADGNVIYVACGQRIYAINRADGNQKWRYPSGEPNASNFKSSPLLVNDTIVASAANNTIYAVDAATGAFKWSYVAESPIVGSLVSNGKVVAFSLGDRAIMAVNLADGTPFYANSDGTADPLTIQDGITGHIGIWNENVLVVSGGRVFYSINLATRRSNWHVEFDSLGPDVQPVATKTTVYLTSGSYLVALNAATGTSQFQKDTGADLAFTAAVGSEAIGVVTKEGKFFAYDLTGNLIARDPIDLMSDAFTAPTALPGGLFVVPTSNGAINLVDPKAGILWNYPIRPVGGIQEVSNTNNGKGGRKGGLGGGPGGGLGGPGGGLGGGGGGDSLGQLGQGGIGGQGGFGQGGPGNQNKKPTKIVTIQAAGPATLAGTTLLVLGRDGSLLAFDRTLGVDLTAPTVVMTFPNPGDQVNPNPPLELVFRIEDEASGVNEKTLKITIDGKDYDYDFTSEGFAVVKFSAIGKNRPMRDGRRKIIVEVSDWMGNKRHEEFVLTADTNLPLVVLPGTPQKGRGPNGGPGGGLGGPGGGKGGG